MVRRRKSTTRKPHKEAGTSQRSRDSIADLPSHMLLQIFLVLPTWSIVMCKSVCKAWHATISSREFITAHWAQSKECTLMRKSRWNLNTSSFFLLEDDELRSGYCVCVDRDATCKQCQVNTPVKARLKTPLINPRYRLIEREWRNEVMNSCNGLLCLYTRQSPDRLMICNPVTSEFIRLPKSTLDDVMVCGLGFSPEHNEYKVVMTRGVGYGVVVAEIHTIGTKSWRRLESWPTNFELEDFSTVSAVYLDGGLHWIVSGDDNNEDGGDSLFTFDLNTEQSQVHSLPIRKYGGSLMVQGGRLYLYDTSDYTQVQIWVMVEIGNPNDLTKLFSVNFPETQVLGDPFRLDTKHYQLLCCEDDEVAVIFDTSDGELIYYDRLQGLKFKAVKFRNHGCEFYFEALTYTPSFISLKDIVRVDNVKVLNLISKRRGKREDKESGILLLRGKRH